MAESQKRARRWEGVSDVKAESTMAAAGSRPAAVAAAGAVAGSGEAAAFTVVATISFEDWGSEETLAEAPVRSQAAGPADAAKR